MKLAVCVLCALIFAVPASAAIRLNDRGAAVKAAQQACNDRIKNSRYPMQPLHPDGHWGKTSSYTCLRVAYYLGADTRNLDDGPYWVALQTLVGQPKTRTLSVARTGGLRRKDFTKDFPAGQGTAGAQYSIADGTTWADGYPVPFWVVPHILYARRHGWTGEVTSGYRSNIYQSVICNSPPFPRPCAAVGHSMHRFRSNQSHVGAIDVSDPYAFQGALRGEPFAGRLIHFIPAYADPWHFSSTGG